MTRTALSVLALFAAAGSAGAEQILIDDPAACPQVLGSEDGLLDFASGGGLILGAGGYNSLEYYCTFQPALNFGWQGYRVSDHIGRCELPGPQYYPQLFTIVMDAEEPGIVAVWDGGDEPIRFHACAG